MVLMFLNYQIRMKMEKINSRKIILIDSDVISHFITNNCLSDLPVILSPHRCTILDYVYNELARHPFRKSLVDFLIKNGDIELMKFPDSNIAIKEEFAKIKKMIHLIGDGERACMAVAKFNKDIIASSNFRDIAPYCEKNNILYLGALDILSYAVSKDIYNEAKCDDFIQNAIRINKARFPKGVTQMKFYIPGNLSFL